MVTRPWFCDRCGYALADEYNWQVHQGWHEREDYRPREQHYKGPLVVIQSLDDPGDMGEPREWTENGVDYLVVPAWECWPRSKAEPQ